MTERERYFATRARADADLQKAVNKALRRKRPHIKPLVYGQVHPHQKWTTELSALEKNATYKGWKHKVDYDKIAYRI